ncbi:response regulator [Shewanella sp. UCD-KL12]|uniref:response regulator n=1 Tax=Shewanella sp. UCD-KL12 TaxID=1917163 RepID=UPI000970F6D1|nr:response regulator [Shewanella sp. UCD-KL12]
MYISFDEFSINTVQQEFVIDDQSIQIDERICSLFSLLIESYPNHCNKQACLQHIWPDTVVSDMSLSKLVSDTRKIFKNAGCEAAIIQTVHGRGYRLSQALGRQLLNQDALSTSAHANLASSHSTSISTSDNTSNTSQSSAENAQVESVAHFSDAENTAKKVLASDLRGESVSHSVGTASGGEVRVQPVIVQAPIQARLKSKFDRLIHEWPKLTTILSSIVISFIILFGLLSTPLFDAYLMSGKSAIDEHEIVYSERPDAIGRVLWIDDHPENNRKEREFLRSQNIGVYSTTSSKEAVRLIGLYRYDLIISDMGREEDAIAGLKLLESLRAKGIFIPYYIYTFNTTEEIIAQVSLSGGQGVAVEADELFKQVMLNFE